MLLPVLLASEGGGDATAYVIAGLAAAVSTMAGLIATIALAKFGSLTKKGEESSAQNRELEKSMTAKIHALEISNEQLRGSANTANSEIAALKLQTVTREHLDSLTAQQNRTLADHTDMLRNISEEVRVIDKTKASRSDLRAVSIPQRRTDGPTDNSPIERRDPTDPPPMRSRLPSRGKYGGGAE